MNCSYCGAAIVQGARYCAACGSAVDIRPHATLAWTFREIPNQDVAWMMMRVGVIGCGLAAVYSLSGSSLTKGAMAFVAVGAGVWWFQSRTAALLAAALYLLSNMTSGWSWVGYYFVDPNPDPTDPRDIGTIAQIAAFHFLQLVAIPLLLINGVRGAIAWHWFRSGGAYRLW